MAGRIDGRYETRYSDVIKGNPNNHKRNVRFDHSPNGYIGITAYEPHSTARMDPEVGDRVLLSPDQVKALMAFVKSRGRSTAR